eukprot:4514042-Prymnesium_polylepis.1
MASPPTRRFAALLARERTLARPTLARPTLARLTLSRLTARASRSYAHARARARARRRYAWGAPEHPDPSGRLLREVLAPAIE